MTSPTDQREPQQDRSRATRARLLESAITCLADRGYAASTVAVVAQDAGVSRGAAQHHFPTREALFTAALEHVTHERGEQMRRELGEQRAQLDTEAVVAMVFELFTGPLFRAALVLWVAAASDPQLREQVVVLEARVGREVHHVVLDLLGVDESEPGVRETVQATLDLARGIGLANLLTDDGKRRSRIATQWARTLEASLGQARRPADDRLARRKSVPPLDPEGLRPDLDRSVHPSL
ncbi:TetR/AcrR family transcriptional regulator [Dermatophilaceae bacterium Soc4.6]